MAFTVRDYQDMVTLLNQHPEWQEQLRRLLIQDDFLRLPKIVQELAQQMQVLGQHVDDLSHRLDALAKHVDDLSHRLDTLAKHVDDLSQRLDTLTQRVDALAEAQKRTEQKVEELAEAQKRTEQKVEELAEAQKRTEQKVDNLGVAVGQLQRAFGSTVEEEAASVIEVVLRRKGHQPIRPAFSLALNGEIDVILPVQDPGGRLLWALVEAKARLSRRDIHDWAQRVRSADWHARLAERGFPGPYLAYAYSIRADLGAQEEAEKEGIGLLKSDGETLPPGELIEPVNKKG